MLVPAAPKSNLLTPGNLFNVQGLSTNNSILSYIFSKNHVVTSSYKNTTKLMSNYKKS